MRWRLLIEEYGPDIIYIKFLDSVASSEISRLSLSNLPTKNNPTTLRESFVIDSISMYHYRMDATDQEMMLLSYKILQKYQNKGKSIQKS